jgi:hypothetical protein
MRRRPLVTILMLIIAVILTLPMQAQQKAVAPGFSPAKPFTEEQVSNVVRSGLGDDSGAKLIEQRGIDFAPVGSLSMGVGARTEVIVRMRRGGVQCA